MFWVRSLFVLVLLCFASAAHAQVGCVPNPNLNGPPFIDGCPIPAAALNHAFAAGPVTGTSPTVINDVACWGNATATLLIDCNNAKPANINLNQTSAFTGDLAGINVVSSSTYTADQILNFLLTTT